MSSKKIKNFDSVLLRLKKALSSTNIIQTIHTLDTPGKNYPLIKIVVGKGNLRRILISAGIHGDEPGGVETILKFFEKNYHHKYADTCEFTILPCINPYGYEYETRENYQKKDLNRFFKCEKPPKEVEFVQSIFDSKFELTLELHEDDESHGYYLYQKERSQKYERLGLNILQSIKDIIPINKNNEIDGSKAKRGIINNNQDLVKMDWWPMALYGFIKGAEISLTLEAPSQYNISTRVEAHLTAITTALDNLITIK